MATQDDDVLEGDFGKRRGPSLQGRAAFPSAPVMGTGKRARATWINRPRGAGRVKLTTPQAPSRQRVIVKIKTVVHASGGNGAASALMRHTLYVERDGAGADGDKVHVFDREHDHADAATFAKSCEDDRHHFRIIISPEHGDRIRDLKRFTRDLMDRIERDLANRTPWIAAVHHDTGTLHVHLVMRGRREDGRDVIIPRAYASHTFRQRAEEIATGALGPRLEPSLGARLDRSGQRAAKVERLTQFDRTLLQRARDFELGIADLPEEARARAILVQRLNRLEELGLAVRQAGDRWRLDRELADKLLRLGDTRDRERAITRLLAKESHAPELLHTRDLEQALQSHRITGRLVGFEPTGRDMRGPHMVGVEALDGCFWIARVARLEDLRGLNGVERGAVVSLERAAPDLRASDRTILEVAGQSRVYSVARHRLIIPSDRGLYIEMHLRRLEALSMDGIVVRAAPDAFYLPDDYRERVLQREARGGRESARLTLLDPRPVDKQAAHRGPVWIDGFFDGQLEPGQVAHTGFGQEARHAWMRREETLKALGIAREYGDQLALIPGWRTQLRAIEHADLKRRIERETGRVPHLARDGEHVQGLFVNRIHAHGLSYALIIEDRTATLTPWRPDMDRALNQFVSGRINSQRFDFTCRRGVLKDIAKGMGLAP